MRRRLTVCLSLAALFGAGLAPAQDPVEFSRLSTDQKQLAEQVRRLEKILITLETREREEGATLRADLLKQAREKLINGAKERPLASVLEEVALDLADLRAGAALERQAELIRFLEDLLDFLLETERRDQVQDLMQAAREREAAFRALAQEQAELRERTEALQQREAESGQVDAQARADLAAEQAELNERIREAAAQDQNSAGSERAENAAAEGERAESELDPSREGSDAETGEESERAPSDTGEQGENSPGEQGENSPGEQGEQGENSPGETGEPGEQTPGEAGENEAGESDPSEPGEQSETESGEQAESQSGEQGEPQEGQPSERQPGEQQEAGERPPSQPQGQQPQQGQQPPQGQQPQQPQQPRDPQEQLERAEEFQRKAEAELERGADEAAAEAERLEGVDELETLINVLEKAEELLTRHQRVLRDLGTFVAEMDGTARVPRSARVDLRGWASEQRSIAEEADSLLFEIREAGADSFPFLLRGLVDDHGLLARRIGPPKYRADTQAVELGARVQRDWERLVNAIRTEAERLREKIEQPEQPPQDGETPPGEGEEPPPQPPSPLVSVAAEVQLLKQLQVDLLERMQSLQSRRELLSSAGIELDEDDLAELEAVVQRQKRLRTLFESILERLQDTGETGEEI